VAASNKDTVRKVQEAWSQNRLADLDQYFAPDFKANGNDPSGPPTLAAAKAAHGMMNQTFSERKIQILDLLEDGDRVFMRNRATGKHTGGDGWMGAPADGKEYDIESWSIYRFRDGKIVESWGLNDGMRLTMQIGGQLPQRLVAATAAR
jgi:ketosteroid isomerase-like protein